jgi:predicted secreted protein
MKHYLILKFRDRACVPQVAAKAGEVLGRLREELDGVREVRVHVNSVPRDENHDVMIVSDFDDESVLLAYLRHPRHAEFVSYAGPLVVSKITFDR